MKILHTVEFYRPSLGGAQEVVKQLSERMAEKGHDVTVATTKLPSRKDRVINGVKIEEFDIRGNLVRGIKGESKKYQDFLVNGGFDVVMNYAAQQWATDLAFDVLDSIKAKKILVPCGYSSLTHPTFKDYFAGLPKFLKKYDVSVYMSPTYQDIEFAKKHGIQNLHIIPNGADEREFTDLSGHRAFRKKFGIKHFFLLTVGNHTDSKGHAETLEAYKHFNFPSTMAIVGHKVDEGCYEKCKAAADEINTAQGFRDKKVLLLELDRADTVAALKAADLFVFFSNIEASPLVLFEAAAAGTPFIAAAAGNSAEVAEWTGGGVIAKTYPYPGRENNVTVDIRSTVSLMETLRAHPLSRRKLSKAGRHNWQEKFTWDKIADQYLKLYEESVK